MSSRADQTVIVILLESKSGALLLRVRVASRSPRTMIRGESEGVLRIALAAPPVDGEANEELIRFIAKRLDVGREMITISSGRTSRNKVVAIRGSCQDRIRQMLAED